MFIHRVEFLKLFCFTVSLFNVASSHVYRRANSCDESSPPGIGFEFEAGELRFQSRSTTKAHTDGLKGKVVNNQKDRYWRMTVDTMGEVGQLNGELILDGTQIRLGSSDAVNAASTAINHLVSCSIHVMVVNTG